jgi:hypothetical protein
MPTAFQEPVVGAVAHQHLRGRRKFLGQVFRALRIAFDHPDLVAIGQCLGQAPSDVATAAHHDSLVGLFQLPQLRRHRADVLLRGHEEDLVLGLNHGIAVGADRAIAPEDGRNAGLDARHVGADLAQLVTDQRPSVVGLDPDQRHQPVGEVQDLQRARMLDQALDLAGDDRLRRDQHVDRDRIRPEQSRIVVVTAFAHPGDLGADPEQGRPDLAGEHVHFVGVGDRDQHLGLPRTGRLQHARVAAEAVDGPDIEVAGDGLQTVDTGIDHRHVVPVAAQRFGQGLPYLTRADDDDALHAGLRAQPSALSFFGSMPRVLNFR